MSTEVRTRTPAQPLPLVSIYLTSRLDWFEILKFFRESAVLSKNFYDCYRQVNPAFFCSGLGVAPFYVLKVKGFLLFDADPAIGQDSRGYVHNPNFQNKKTRGTSKSQSKKVPNFLSYDGFLEPFIPYHTARNQIILTYLPFC